MINRDEVAMNHLLDFIITKKDVDAELWEALATQESKKIFEVLIDNMLDDIAAYGKFRALRGFNPGQLILSADDKQKIKSKIWQGLKIK